MAAAVPKGYCSAAEVAAVLGVPLTPELQAALDPRIAAAEAAIDAYTGHAWLEPGAHDDPYLVSRPHLNLIALPVDSVQAVLWLAQGPTTQEPTTLETTAYALLEPSTGVLWLGPTWGVSAGGGGGTTTAVSGFPLWLRAQYTAGSTVPPAVATACAETAAVSYRRAGDAGSTAAAAVASGVRRYQVGQELLVEYADRTDGAGSNTNLPPAAQSALAPWRPALAWA